MAKIASIRPSRRSPETTAITAPTKSERLSKMSGDVQALYPRTSQTLDDLHTLEKTFEANLIDVPIVPFSEVDLEKMRDSWIELEEQILALPDVAAVFSPIPALKATDHPLRLISEDRKWARFLIEIPSDLSDGKRQALHIALDSLKPPGSVRSGSFFAAEVATSTLTSESQIRAPLCAISIFILLLCWTRSIVASCIVITPSLLALALISAGLVVFDHPLGAIAQLVPPLLLAVGTSYSSYLAGRILSAKDPTTALHGAGSAALLSWWIVPCLLSSPTVLKIAHATYSQRLRA